MLQIFDLRWILSPFVELSISQICEHLSWHMPNVPSGIEMMVGVTEANLQPRFVQLSVRRQFMEPPKFFYRFCKIESDNPPVEALSLSAQGTSEPASHRASLPLDIIAVQPALFAGKVDKRLMCVLAVAETFAIRSRWTNYGLETKCKRKDRRVDRNSKLVSEWIAFWYSPDNSADHERFFWAFDAAMELSHDSPDGAWEFIMAVLNKDSSPKIVESLAAGPLEDLLVRHGATVIDRVEREAKSNPAFATLLGGVWRSRMSDEIL